MKKVLAIMLIFSSVFLFSCGIVSIKELLTFQSESYTAKLTVKNGEEDVPVTVVKDGETFTFVIDEKYTFVSNGDKWSVSYSGLSVPISKETAKRSIPQKLMTALTAKTDGKWKITEDDSADNHVIKCESTSQPVTFYFSAETKAPEKMVCDGIECSFEKFVISEK